MQRKTRTDGESESEISEQIQPDDGYELGKVLDISLHLLALCLSSASCCRCCQTILSSSSWNVLLTA